MMSTSNTSWWLMENLLPGRASYQCPQTGRLTWQELMLTSVCQTSSWRWWSISTPLEMPNAIPIKASAMFSATQRSKSSSANSGLGWKTYRLRSGMGKVFLHSLNGKSRLFILMLCSRPVPVSDNCCWLASLTPSWSCIVLSLTMRSGADGRPNSCALACVRACRNAIYIATIMHKSGLLNGWHAFAVYPTYFTIVSLLAFMLENSSLQAATDGVLIDAIQGKGLLADSVREKHRRGLLLAKTWSSVQWLCCVVRELLQHRGSRQP